MIATPTHGLLGAELVEDGDRICIRTECWTYEDGVFTSGKLTARIPPRQAKLPGLDVGIPLPFASPITAGTRTYAIDYLARNGHAAPPEETLRSFVAYARPGPRLRLMVLDESVTLRKAKPEPAPLRYDIADGTRIHFYTLPTVGETFETRGLVERRSVIHRAGHRGFALDFDTPEVHSLSERELAALHVQGEENQKAVALAMGDAQLVDRSLYFSGASESVALQSSALVELPRFFPHNPGSSLRIMSPRGPADAQLGRVTWIGASDLAAVRLDVVRPPFLMLLAALALQLLKVFAASSMRFTYAQALLAGALEILVGVRLLFGHRVWSMPPHNLEAAELGVLAWMALPWIFLVASLPSLHWRRYPLPLAGLLFSMVFCALLVEGPKKFVWIACHLLALVVPVVRSRGAATLPPRRRGLSCGSHHPPPFRLQRVGDAAGRAHLPQRVLHPRGGDSAGALSVARVAAHVGERRPHPAQRSPRVDRHDRDGVVPPGDSHERHRARAAEHPGVSRAALSHRPAQPRHA
ncbi:MAG TPA: hypothetical protein VHK90_05675, partial [Thermoanaerobaculia bacterium]|nr:hypothetical protein [Thermoanaerobaculia bacterium]